MATVNINGTFKVGVNGKFTVSAEPQSNKAAASKVYSAPIATLAAADSTKNSRK